MIRAVATALLRRRGYFKVWRLPAAGRFRKGSNSPGAMVVPMKLRTAGLVIVGSVVFAIVLGVAFQLNYAINVEYPYRMAIGAHIDNAYDASSFEVMRDNLLRAKAGMVAQGLEPTDCGRFFSWERTPDMCMEYTYQYIDGLVNRTEFYIGQMSKLNQTQFTDIYTQAIENMRKEMNRNGPVDWAAYPAWILKYAPLYYWGRLVWLGIVALPIVTAALIIAFAERWIED